MELKRQAGKTMKHRSPISDLFRKLLTILKRQAKEMRPPRMCPFCGLITSGDKASCLECGKSFKPA